MSGRPLRFLGGVGVGWIGLRVAMLWPPAATLIEDAVPSLPRALSQAETAPASTPRSLMLPGYGASPAGAPHRALLPVRATATADAPIDRERALALLSAVRFGEAMRQAPALLPGLPRPQPASPTIAAAPPASRWSGSAWLFARGGRGIAPGANGGQLGGAQAGMRVAYLLDRAHRLALAGRATTPLRGRGTELAAGLEWQPTRAPLRIVAEQRFGVDGLRSAPAIGAVGGIGPLAVAPRLNAEGYAQAGVIGADRGAYVDAAARVATPLATIGEIRFDLGAGAWGGAQKGAARLDLGPSLAAALPIGRVGARLSIDWRQRIAGGARPGSGLVVSLGTDF